MLCARTNNVWILAKDACSFTRKSPAMKQPPKFSQKSLGAISSLTSKGRRSPCEPDTLSNPRSPKAREKYRVKIHNYYIILYNVHDKVHRVAAYKSQTSLHSNLVSPSSIAFSISFGFSKQ